MKCKNCGQNFTVEKAHEEFFRIHDLGGPLFCRFCEWQRKLSWDNEYKLYKRKCDLTGEVMLSVFNEEAPFPVYKRERWLKNEYDLPMVLYDKNRSFFEQYWELFSIAPRPNVNSVNAENSEYAHLIFDSKSCYLSFQVFLCEKVLGCYRVIRLKDSANCFFCIDSELLCECVNCAKSYNLKFCEDCEDSSDSAFLYDCRGCRNCFMCWNLRNKTYCFKNKQLKKEEYEKKITEYNLSEKSGLDDAKKEFENLRENFIVKNSHQMKCEKCVGDYLVGCKNCEEIYFSDGCQDSVNVLRGTEDVTSFDAVVGGKIELCYNVLQPGYSYKCAFMWDSNHLNECYFCENCDNCVECLGCISLKRGKNCILNKKYSKEEYDELKKHIFEELNRDGGYEEFFDPKKSPFKYEETIADLYFPMTKDVLYKTSALPGKCPGCGKDLQFAQAEKDFYEKMKIALPEECFYCRILKMAGPYSSVIMEKVACQSCGKEVLTPKSSRNFGKVYCEECYLKEVY